VPIGAGDIVVMQSAGGGGYGDPLARDPAHVREDVRAGYVSPERARLGYGVVLMPNGDVDLSATRAERERLAAARRRFPVVADERNPYEGRLGRHRVLRVTPAMAGDLGLATGDLLELLGRHPAPLRAWVRVEVGVTDEQIALDAFGRRILGVSPGDTVEVRRLSMPPIPGGLVSG
jgi:N-methylhydantoinase B